MSSNRYGDRDKGRDLKSDLRPSRSYHDTNRNDERSIRCRIFVGNLNTETLTRAEFEEVFAKYGHILGSSLHTGFGFVQYEKESEADEAVAKVHGTQIRGRRVDVNLAGERRKDRKRGSSDEKPSGYGRRDRSLSPRRVPPLDDDIRSPLRDDDYYHSRPKDPYPPASYPVDDVPSKKLRPNYNDEPLAPLPAPGAPIDCEIIIINKQQRTYADEVEKKIRARGLVVECAHLPESVNLKTELEDASKRGVLYGINITSQHEVHRSVTVHILHGSQQEHRNMPLEDAISLVARNFDTYMQALREREQAREKEQALKMDMYDTKSGYNGPAAPQPGVYSREVLHLLNIAADDKYLLADEYTEVIKELTSIRDDILKKEGRPIPNSGSSKPFPTDPQSIALQQAELQAKILSILNPSSKAKTTAAASITKLSTTVTESKPALSIPVLTPSYSSSPAFQSSESTITSQSVLNKPLGAGNIIGMALSNLRAKSSNTAASGPGYPSSSPYVPATSATATTQAWAMPQYRPPNGSTTYGPRTPGKYMTSGPPNTYRRY